jgi:hypothetical protein
MLVMLSFAARLATLALLLNVGGPVGFAAIGLWPATPAQAAQTLPKSLTVLGKTLVLKDNHGGAPGEKFIAEYVPVDETLDNWTLLFASRFDPGVGLDPMASALAAANRVSARKQSGDLLANSAVFRAGDGKSVVVDFLISEGDIVEHNVFRYFNTSEGLVSLQIARRIYNSKAKEGDLEAFIKAIKTKRNEIVRELTRADLPHQ